MKYSHTFGFELSGQTTQPVQIDFFLFFLFFFLSASFHLNNSPPHNKRRKIIFPTQSFFTNDCISFFIFSLFLFVYMFFNFLFFVYICLFFFYFFFVVFHIHLVLFLQVIYRYILPPFFFLISPILSFIIPSHLIPSFLPVYLSS